MKKEDTDILLRLNESKDFAYYLQMLRDGALVQLKQLGTLLSATEDVAKHNYLVGMLEGTRKAIGLVASLIAQLELDQQTAPEKQPRRKK